MAHLCNTPTMINKKDNENLLPCPCCGNAARYFQHPKPTTQADLIGVECIECGVSVERANFADYKVKHRQDAVTKIWNNRI